MKACVRLACAFFVLTGVSACAPTIFHKPVPEANISAAVVEGFPESIRFWSDEAPPNVEALVSERLASYRAANASYFEQHHAYPPLNYLAISGGANDGAFGAGLLTGWTESGHRPDFELVSGVSTGALIAPFAFIGPKYDPLLRTFFTTTNSDSIFVTGFWNIIQGITGGLALADTAPLAKKIDVSVTPEIMEEIAAEYRRGRRLYIGTTNMEAQRGVIWDIGAIANSGNPGSLKLIHQIMLASASIPGIFKPVFIDVKVAGKRCSEIHADGGVTSQVFIYPLKLRRSIIEEFIRVNPDRHLYVIRNSKITPEYQALKPALFSLSRRSIETLIKYQGLGDLYRLYLGTQRDHVDYNLAYIPESFNTESREVFDPAYMRNLFDFGHDLGLRSDAWLKKPPGVDYSPEDDPPVKALVPT